MSSRAAVAPPEAVRTAVRQSILPLVLFCVGHFLVDLYSGALGALQPLLQSRFGLNFTQAGILGGVMVCSSSVMQPVYGLLSDRWHSRLFTVLAPGLASGPEQAQANETRAEKCTKPLRRSAFTLSMCKAQRPAWDRACPSGERRYPPSAAAVQAFAADGRNTYDRRTPQP